MSDTAPSTEAPCLACGARDSTLWATGTDEEYHTGRDVYSYRQCRTCHALFIQPVPRDRLGQIYPPNYYSFSGPDASRVQQLKTMLDCRLFRSLLGGLPGPELRVLDVGGGAGWELTLIKSVDPRVTRTTVVDIDEGAAAVARAAGHEYVCRRIEDFDATEPFDLILLLNIIEHVDNPGAVLAKIANLLSPQGVALVKTPNYDSLDARLFRDRNWAGYHCPRHWVLFTKSSFLTLAARSGLKVRSFRYTQGAPFWAASVVIQLARRNSITVTADRPVLTHPLYGVLVPLFAALDFARRPLAKLSQMFVVLERPASRP